jgi:hypothetical protein
MTWLDSWVLSIFSFVALKPTARAVHIICIVGSVPMEEPANGG